MANRITPNILVERVSKQRVKDFHDAYIESLPALYAGGLIDTTDPLSEKIGTWQDWISEFDKDWENDQGYSFQVVEVGTNQVVGGVFLNDVARYCQMANLGYWVRTNRRGEGIATEAVKQAARYGFEKLGFQRLEIVVKTENTPSLKVAEKTGAIREGLLRNRFNFLGVPCDAYMHSLIPSDFGMRKTA
jgi:RimJ/RimL family protein N-acetyltransferase